MAAELCTGLLVLKTIETLGYQAATLIVSMEADFHKKAVGNIYFHSFISEENSAELVGLKLGEDVSFTMTAIGSDQEKEVVSTFRFEWSVKRKS